MTPASLSELDLADVSDVVRSLNNAADATEAPISRLSILTAAASDRVYASFSSLLAQLRINHTEYAAEARRLQRHRSAWLSKRAEEFDAGEKLLLAAARAFLSERIDYSVTITSLESILPLSVAESFAQYSLMCDTPSDGLSRALEALSGSLRVQAGVSVSNSTLTCPLFIQPGAYNEANAAQLECLDELREAVTCVEACDVISSVSFVLSDGTVAMGECIVALVKPSVFTLTVVVPLDVPATSVEWRVSMDNLPLPPVSTQVGGTINGTFLREIPIPEVKDDHRGIAINKDGSLMCVSCMGGEGRGKLFLYALPSGDFLHAFKGHSSSDLSRAKICFAPATGNILVAEQSGGLHATECTVNGDFVRGFLTATTETGPKSSFGIAASESLVATASSDPPSVRLFRYADATLLRKVTAEGANPYLNCFPPGIRFTPDGAHFVVCHYYNSGPVSVFTSAGDYVKSFSSPAFNHPYDVDFARNGDVIVASWCGHTLSVVSRIDSEMKVLRTFGGDGSGPGQTHCPAAFAVSAGKLYAIDYKHHRVQVFE